MYKCISIVSTVAFNLLSLFLRRFTTIRYGKIKSIAVKITTIHGILANINKSLMQLILLMMQRFKIRQSRARLKH